MRHSICMATILVGCLTAAKAIASDCSDARESYSSVLKDLSYELARYSKCLNYSDGTDDCSSEFKRLKNAQGDLESAVSEIASYCEY